MKITYFQSTDTLYIEFRPASVAETRDFDEKTQIDLDSNGSMCALTVEHASCRVDLPGIDFEQVTA